MSEGGRPPSDWLNKMSAPCQSQRYRGGCGCSCGVKPTAGLL